MTESATAQNLPDTIPPDSLTTLPDSTPKGIPIADIIEYRERGLSYAEVAKLVGCSKPNVIERLQTAGKEIEATNNYKKHRADTFANMGSRLINSFTPGDIKKMSGLQKATAVGIFYDKERLERDLSTDNVSHDVLISDMDDKRRAYDLAVKAQLAGTTDETQDGS